MVKQSLIYSGLAKLFTFLFVYDFIIKQFPHIRLDFRLFMSLLSNSPPTCKLNPD